MIYSDKYELRYLDTIKVTTEESFTNYFSDKVCELEKLRTSTKGVCTTLDAKNENAYLN